MYCVHCGKELPGEGSFCPHCGACQIVGATGKTDQEHGNSQAKGSVNQENTHMKKRSFFKNTEEAGRKRLPKLIPVIGVVAAMGVVLLINFGMSNRKLKCPDPALFFGLEWQDGTYDGSYTYFFDETAPSNMDAETAWDAMQEYARLLEQHGAEVSLEDGSGDYIGDRYRLTADFGRYSLLNSGHRDVFIHYYPPEQRFFLTLPYGYDFDRMDYLPTDTYSGAGWAVEGASGEEVSSDTTPPSIDQAESPPDTSEETPDTLPPVITDTAIPDFQAFCNDNLYVYGVTEYSDYTEYCYFWNYNGKTMDEYLDLLQDTYHFKLRGEKVISSIDSYRYSFDYTGSGSAGTYDEDGMDGSDGEGIALYIWDLHADGKTGEIHICVADGLDYMDTGDRTTREVVPYQNEGSSGGSASASGGDKECWYCGGSGDCPTCDGSGTVYNWLPGTTEYVEQDCTDCASPGKCRICGGSGRA